VLGMPGFTAYAGLRNIGRPKPGETVVVAAASGAVGSVVGQIAKIEGARAVGIAGGPEKCAFVRDELGFDVAIDHRAKDFNAQLALACPDGIDVYFENVGGPVAEAVFPLLNDFARIPVCGLIAHYNNEPAEGVDRLPGFMRDVLRKSLTVRGFIQREFADQRPDFLSEASAWLADGRLNFREDIVDGLEHAPRGLHRPAAGQEFREADCTCQRITSKVEMPPSLSPAVADRMAKRRSFLYCVGRRHYLCIDLKHRSRCKKGPG